MLSNLFAEVGRGVQLQSCAERNGMLPSCATLDEVHVRVPDLQQTHSVRLEGSGSLQGACVVRGAGDVPGLPDDRLPDRQQRIQGKYTWTAVIAFLGRTPRDGGSQVRFGFGEGTPRSTSVDTQDLCCTPRDPVHENGIDGS